MRSRLGGRCIPGPSASARLPQPASHSHPIPARRRFVEFLQSTILEWPAPEGTYVLSEQQVLFYTLDTLPILLVFATYILCHPGYLLPAGGPPKAAKAAAVADAEAGTGAGKAAGAAGEGEEESDASDKGPGEAFRVTVLSS